MRIEADEIAIVRLGAIGDVVNCLPFVNRLRHGYPRARITWVIGTKAHSLLAGHPAIDEFVIFEEAHPPRWPAFVRALRRRRFDLVIDLQRITKSGLITRATGSARRLGFDRARCKEASWIFTSERIPSNPRPGVMVEQFVEFADYLALPPSALEWLLPFEPFPATREGETRIVVNLGASRPSKRWYPDAWARLCERLTGELGASVHLSGGREDRPVADLVLGALRAPTSPMSLMSKGPPVIDHVGRLALKQTAGLIASADVFIGCDTGPMHIAAAVGTPCVALFGATDPRRTGPYGALHTIVSRPTPCSPCLRRTCHVAGHPCMRDLAPDFVFERVRTLLAKTCPEKLAI